MVDLDGGSATFGPEKERPLLGVARNSVVPAPQFATGSDFRGPQAVWRSALGPPRSAPRPKSQPEQRKCLASSRTSSAPFGLRIWLIELGAQGGLGQNDPEVWGCDAGGPGESRPWPSRRSISHIWAPKQGAHCSDLHGTPAPILAVGAGFEVPARSGESRRDLESGARCRMSIMAKFGPNSIKWGPASPKFALFDETWPTSGTCGPESTELGPILDRCWTGGDVAPSIKRWHARTPGAEGNSDRQESCATQRIS